MRNPGGSECIRIITASDPEVRNRSLDSVCRAATLQTLLEECEALDEFRRVSANLYEQVRALFFLYAIHRFHIPCKAPRALSARIPHAGHANLLNRRFDEAIELFWPRNAQAVLVRLFRARSLPPTAHLVFRRWPTRCAALFGLCAVINGCSAQAIRRMRTEPATRTHKAQLAPFVPDSARTTPVRMDLTHSGWSDIFFLGMDFPEGARVLNVSIDLACMAGMPSPPPVEAYLRMIDEPVLRLTSVDLEATADLTSIDEVFDFGRDYLGLLKSAVIASVSCRRAWRVRRRLDELLPRLTGPGHGIEIVSNVNNIPKGSRLAVSTNLLASLISVCMRATGQIRALTGLSMKKIAALLQRARFSASGSAAREEDGRIPEGCGLASSSSKAFAPKRAIRSSASAAAACFRAIT